MTDSSPSLDLQVPRSVGQILDAGLRLYVRIPLLLMGLAGAVVIPYSVVTDLVTNAKHVSSETVFLLLLANFALVTPFVVAMQMQVLLMLAGARRPTLRDVIARGFKVLPAVAASEIVATLIAIVGFVLFIVPGVFAHVRLAVAGQAAACEQLSWPDAIRRSAGLTRGSGWRVLGLLIIEDVLTYLVAAITGAASPALVVVGTVGAIVVESFCTLLICLLYFDLRAREAAPVAWR